MCTCLYILQLLQYCLSEDLWPTHIQHSSLCLTIHNFTTKRRKQLYATMYALLSVFFSKNNGDCSLAKR